MPLVLKQDIRVDVSANVLRGLKTPSEASDQGEYVQSKWLRTGWGSPSPTGSEDEIRDSEGSIFGENHRCTLSPGAIPKRKG